MKKETVFTKIKKYTKDKVALIGKKIMNPKKSIIDFFKATNNFIKNNLIVAFYILGAVLNGIILRAFTIKSFFAISPILADLFVSIAFASIYFLLKKKRRFAYLMTFCILSTIICIANIVYYHYFSSYISITFISFALTNTDTGGANVVGNLLQLKFFIVLWYPIFLVIANKRIIKNKRINIDLTTKKDKLKIIWTWCSVILLIFLFTLKGYDFSRFHNQWNREYLVSKFGVYLYQLNDVVKSIEPQMASLFGSDSANRKINNYYEENIKEDAVNNYSDIFKDKNVIAIHAESIQTLAMEQNFNGLDVTPNLNKLAREGIYFDNYYSQVSVGTSSDTEFTVATSLMPVNSGTVFVNYPDREYITMYNLLKDKGYYIFSMHANTGDFWNRNVMHKNLGYDKFYEKASYNIDETIGFGLSDKSFFTQSVEYIKENASKNEKFYGTLIMLSNHTPFEDIDKYGEYDVSMTVDGIQYPYLEGTKLGNYFKSVHYADEQIGLLIDLLDQAGILDDTIIVVYGDHDARIARSEWNKLYNYDYTTDSVKTIEDESYVELDSYWYEINRRVPCIIWSKDDNIKQNYAKTVSTVTGMVDLMPTLGNMLGIYNKYALGNDVINSNENVVVFPNGNFLTNYVYYNDNKGEYKLLKDVPLEEDYISKYKEYSSNILEVSNDIVVYNYFKKELSTERYEGEN